MHHKKGREKHELFLYFFPVLLFGQFENLPVTYVGIYEFYFIFLFEEAAGGLCLFMTNLEATGGGDLSNAVKAATTAGGT